MNGGHSPTKANYQISYDDEVKKVKGEHQEWEPTDIRKEVALRLRPRFRQDKVAYENETKNFQEYDGPEFTLKNGEVYYQLYDRSLDELNTRTLELTPDQYSLAQHQASAVINKAFKDGATEVVTSYYREGQDHRDLLVMKIDPATGIGKTRIINCAQNGNYHDFTNMQSIAKSRFTTHYEIRPTDNVFILSNKPVNYDAAGKAVNEVARQYEDYLRSKHNGVQTIARGMIESSRNTVQEIGSTVISIDRYVQRMRGNRLQDVPMMVGDTLMQRVRRMFDHKEDKKDLVVFPYQQGQKTVEDKGLKREESKVMNLSVNFVEQAQRKVKEKIKTSVATLLFVRVTGVGIGGAFASLESLVRRPQLSVEQAKRLRKEGFKGQKRKEMQLKRKYILENMHLFKMSKSFKKLTKKEQRAFRRKEKTLLSKEKKLLRRKERKSVKRKERILWEIVRKLVKKGKSIEQKPLAKKLLRKEIHEKSAKISKERLIKRKEKQHAVDFSLALVIWLLLHMQRSNKQISVKEKPQEITSFKHEQSNKHVSKEPAPWILLAIVWHLAMLREQGVRRGLNDPKYNNKKVQKHQAFPRVILPTQGVIFAFAS